MSVYQVTREGQNLGSFEASQIQEGLQTGQFLESDWGWREGMSGWKGLTEIFGDSPAQQPRALASSFSSLVRKSPVSKPAESINPYAAPASNRVISRSSGELPSDVMLEMQNTRPWVLFIAVVMWVIGGGFLILFLINIFLTGSPATISVFKSGSLVSMISYMVGFGLGLAVVAYVIIYPTLKLTRYALKIARFTKSESFADLAEALSEQRQFWRFQGVILLANLGFGLLILIWSLAVR
ncbi:MAG: hypothetical protein NTY98_16865 [Verrucomicrobia bacterium]|nr:hypothetical protein [Verrucomicrobiota bacterium]